MKELEVTETSEIALDTVAATDGSGFQSSHTYLEKDSESSQSFHYEFNSALVDTHDASIGLACLPIQKRLQAVRNGANFTIMLVGESGVGKTSFINTLFNSSLIKQKSSVSTAGTTDSESQPSQPWKDSFQKRTTTITPYRMDLTEEDFTMRCTVIDTPGFGDFINNKYCWYPITRYIDEQYRRLVYQECQPNRSSLIHNEVHACLYFIKPSGTELTSLDIEAMKSLSTRVNLIPIISKADAFTKDELNEFKHKVRQTLIDNGIEMCQFIKDSKSASTMIADMPFTIINSVSSYKNNKGELVRGRKYGWGVAEVENPYHCDFLKLREFLLGSHMGDLMVSTEGYYENYRRDFMKFRLGLSLQQVLKASELESLGLEVSQPSTKADMEISSVHTKGSWKSATLKEAKAIQPKISQESLDRLTEMQDSTTILKLIDKFSLSDTEKELILLNPAYLDMEQFVKERFTADVKKENQRFKNWKRALFNRQDKFNRDIDDLHSRAKELQAEIRSYVNAETISKGR